jgi:hypothetical protein
MNHFIYRLFAVTLLSLFALGTIQARKVQTPKMYMFGFAASFADTIVHFTEVQELDTVWMESRKHFLLGREIYSHQLRNFLETQRMPGRTCVVFYNTKRSKLEKQYLKMKRLYDQAKDGRKQFDVRYLNNGDFQFKPATLTFDEEEVQTRKNSEAKMRVAPPNPKKFDKKTEKAINKAMQQEINKRHKADERWQKAGQEVMEQKMKSEQ